MASHPRLIPRRKREFDDDEQTLPWGTPVPPVPRPPRRESPSSLPARRVPWNPGVRVLV